MIAAAHDDDEDDDDECCDYYYSKKQPQPIDDDDVQPKTTSAMDNEVSSFLLRTAVGNLIAVFYRQWQKKEDDQKSNGRAIAKER
jgi:hypothetical protein